MTHIDRLTSPVVPPDVAERGSLPAGRCSVFLQVTRLVKTSQKITLKTTKLTNFRVLNHPKKWNSSPSNPPRDPDSRFQGGPHRVASLASPAGHLRAESHPGNTPSAPDVLSWTVEPSKTWGLGDSNQKNMMIWIFYGWLYFLWAFLWIVNLGMIIFSNGWVLFDVLCETNKKGGKPIGWADSCQQNLGFN